MKTMMMIMTRKTIVYHGNVITPGIELYRGNKIDDALTM